MAQMMRVMRYVSDLHLELRANFEVNELKPLWTFEPNINTEYYLALVGDIGNPFQRNLRPFLEQVSSRYKQVFYIPGNHEYYNVHVKTDRSKDDFEKELIKMCGELPNVSFLNNSTYQLPGIKIIGTTLWSHIPEAKSRYYTHAINDYNLIKKNHEGKLVRISTGDTNRWNAEAIAFLEKEIGEEPCIVLTHHAPLFNNPDLDQYLAHPQYTTGMNNYAFHNDLLHLIKSPIIAWLYGHTHHTSNFNVNGVYIGTNQLGYSHESCDFNPLAFINLD